MGKARIEWKDEMKGHLAILLDDPKNIHTSRSLIDYLYNNYNSDDCTYFKDEEIKIMGATALFMAIREQAPYERGRVLDHAVEKLGGTCGTMGGYDFFSFFSTVCPPFSDITFSFIRGCKKLASYLEPIKAESQYSLRCVAFDFVEKLFEK